MGTAESDPRFDFGLADGTATQNAHPRTVAAANTRFIISPLEPSGWDPWWKEHETCHTRELMSLSVSSLQGYRDQCKRNKILNFRKNYGCSRLKSGGRVARAGYSGETRSARRACSSTFA